MVTRDATGSHGAALTDSEGASPAIGHQMVTRDAAGSHRASFSATSNAS